MTVNWLTVVTAGFTLAAAVQYYLQGSPKMAAIYVMYAIASGVGATITA